MSALLHRRRQVSPLSRPAKHSPARPQLGALAVAVSPHLDDAVFSAGGTLAMLAAEGWRVRVVTCFTASVADPSPFALSTQLDKGLGVEIDYMALRRAEDVAALSRLGAEPVHLPLPEAPHRGYTSAPDLFAGQHADDEIAAPLADALAPHLREVALVLAPQAIGDHVDHRVVVDVVRQMAAAPVLWWRDAPYVLRRPEAPSWHGVPAGVDEAVDIAEYRETKIAAACCYTTQLGFQFGGAAHVAAVLADAEERFRRTTSDGAGGERQSLRGSWPQFMSE